MYNTILVGTDGSEGASRAVAHATELARRFGGRLHLVSVAGPMPRSAAARVPHDELTQEARLILARAAEPARSAGVHVETHAVMGAPAGMLVELAVRVHADVIVVGNRGMVGTRRLLGSVPNDVAHHAPCSVLIVDTVHADS